MHVIVIFWLNSINEILWKHYRIMKFGVSFGADLDFSHFVQILFQSYSMQKLVLTRRKPTLHSKSAQFVVFQHLTCFYKSTEHVNL